VRWVKSLLLAVLIVAAAAGGVALLWHHSLPLVRVGRPTVGPAVKAVYATGVVEPVTWAKVTPLVRGRIVDTCACEGQTVKRGDFLVKLDDKRARAELAELEARERFLNQEVERYEALVAKQDVSRQAYERVTSERAQVRAAIAAAGERLSDYTLRAPIDGTVLKRDGEIGEVAEPGQALVWVGQPKPLWVVAEVDEEDIPEVSVGQKALIKADAFPGRALEGDVVRITPKGDPVNKNYRVRIGLPADTPLMIGMTTEVNVVVREVEDVLLVPAGALVGGRVFELKEGRALARPVEAGIRGASMVEVRAGLDRRTTIVLDPPAGLRDGARVRVPESAEAGQ
jgi:RND family efflux transporter MFP subunit